jgi:hypothetical protein
VAAGFLTVETGELHQLRIVGERAIFSTFTDSLVFKGKAKPQVEQDRARMAELRRIMPQRKLGQPSIGTMVPYFNFTKSKTKIAHTPTVTGN